MTLTFINMNPNTQSKTGNHFHISAQLQARVAADACKSSKTHQYELYQITVLNSIFSHVVSCNVNSNIL